MSRAQAIAAIRGQEEQWRSGLDPWKLAL